MLVTGFGPFRRFKSNPSGRLAEAIGSPGVVLEVSFDEVDSFIRRLTLSPPAQMLMLGLHGTAKTLRLERFGRNVIGSKPDVRGSTFGRDKIEPNGPDMLCETLFEDDFDLAGSPETIVWSESAGGYLCNYILYRALSTLPSCRVGFVHVPSVRQVSLAHQATTVRWLIDRAGEARQSLGAVEIT